ncbi:MAG: phage tail assembly protein [Candidatus Sedimenticola sp. 6PFRAG7]
MSDLIKLKHPVTVKGQEHTELKMRAPKVRDMLAGEKVSGSAGEQEVVIFANLCEVGREVIEELHLADYQDLQQVYQGFLS